MAKAKAVTGLDPHAPPGENARIIIKTRLEEMYEWAEYVDSPYRVRELHNLRIAAKRLRYTFEILEDMLPEAGKAVIKELAQIQEELGALHDSDVLIALLRLCLGSQDSGVAYEDALARANKQHSSKELILPAELVADLVDPKYAPSAEERYGLEQMVVRQQHQREERYRAFRQHWYLLQGRDFRREILDIIEA